MINHTMTLSCLYAFQIVDIGSEIANVDHIMSWSEWHTIMTVLYPAVIPESSTATSLTFGLHLVAINWFTLICCCQIILNL